MKLTHATFYPVMEGKKIVIPANSENVKVAFGQSSRPLLDSHGNKTKKMQNAYMWHGVVYNA